MSERRSWSWGGSDARACVPIWTKAAVSNLYRDINDATRDDDDAAGRTIEDIINAHTHPRTDRAKFEAKSYDEEDEKTTLALCSEWHKTMPILWQRGNPIY